jgi:hypothetical protein
VQNRNSRFCSAGPVGIIPPKRLRITNLCFPFSSSSMEWPTELLAEFARFLALDGHTAAFQRFADLTMKNSEFKSAVGKLQQPLVLCVAFDGEVADHGQNVHERHHLQSTDWRVGCNVVEQCV